MPNLHTIRDKKAIVASGLAKQIIQAGILETSTATEGILEGTPKKEASLEELKLIALSQSPLRKHIPYGLDL